MNLSAKRPGTSGPGTSGPGTSGQAQHQLAIRYIKGRYIEGAACVDDSVEAVAGGPLPGGVAGPTGLPLPGLVRAAAREPRGWPCPWPRGSDGGACAGSQQGYRVF